MSDKKCVGTTASGEKRADGAPRHALETLRWVRSVCGKDLSRVWVLCATRCASAVIAVSFALFMSGAIDACEQHGEAADVVAVLLHALLVDGLAACPPTRRWPTAPESTAPLGRGGSPRHRWPCSPLSRIAFSQRIPARFAFFRS